MRIPGTNRITEYNHGVDSLWEAASQGMVKSGVRTSGNHNWWILGQDMRCRARGRGLMISIAVYVEWHGSPRLLFNAFGRCHRAYHDLHGYVNHLRDSSNHQSNHFNGTISDIQILHETIAAESNPEWLGHFLCILVTIIDGCW